MRGHLSATSKGSRQPPTRLLPQAGEWLQLRGWQGFLHAEGVYDDTEAVICGRCFMMARDTSIRDE